MSLEENKEALDPVAGEIAQGTIVSASSAQAPNHTTPATSQISSIPDLEMRQWLELIWRSITRLELNQQKHFDELRKDLSFITADVQMIKSTVSPEDDLTHSLKKASKKNREKDKEVKDAPEKELPKEKTTKDREATKDKIIEKDREKERPVRPRRHSFSNNGGESAVAEVTVSPVPNPKADEVRKPDVSPRPEVSSTLGTEFPTAIQTTLNEVLSAVGGFFSGSSNISLKGSNPMIKKNEPGEQQSNDSIAASPSRKSDPKLKKSEIKKDRVNLKDKDFQNDGDDESLKVSLEVLIDSPSPLSTGAGRSPRRKHEDRGQTRKKKGDSEFLEVEDLDSSTRKILASKKKKKENDGVSDMILDENHDDAVFDKELEESALPPEALGGHLSKRPRNASMSSVPQAEARMFENFVDDDDITVSEDEAFQQAWVELENQRQRKITSLGPKDIERLLALTNQKLIDQQQTGGSTALAKSHEKSERHNFKHKQRFIITSKYKGPHIPEKITMETIDQMISSFETEEKLHYRYAWQLVTECSAIFEREPNVIDLDIPSHGRLIVVGDTHGQLLDLVTILRKAGMPSENNVYVINGDFVDRGPHGAEVMFILYALKLLYPTFIYLHRGNHEEKRINRLYNFETQIRAKYDAKMFDHIHSSFVHLPLGSLVNKSLFIVHGGLPKEENVTLDEIRAIPRHQELPKPEDCMTRELKIFESLLWSDPVETTDNWSESNRGAGVYWGKSITKSFMSLNNIELLLRSHQLCNTGRKYNHLKHVMTIFSASYYCGINNNKGAVALFDSEGGVKNPKFIEYYSEVDHPGDNTKQKRETLQKIRSRIYKKRRKLYEAFVSNDSDRTGYVSKKAWVKSMVKVLQLPLLWSKIYPYLVVPSSDGRVQYIDFLDRFKIDVGGDGRKWNRMITKKVVDKIVASSLTLKQAFEEYTQQNIDDGLTYFELVSILHGYGFGLSKTMLYDFVRRLDKKKDGKIDFEEFSTGLEPHFHNAVSKEDLPWIKAEMKKLARIIGSSSALREAFKEYQNKKSPETMNFKSFSKYLSELVAKHPNESLNVSVDATHVPDPFVEYTDHQKHKLFSYLDLTESDAVYFEDFESAVFGTDFLQQSQVSLDAQLLTEEVWSLLYRRRYMLRDLFRHVDEDGSGTVDTDEFKACLEAFNETIEKRLTSQQVQQVDLLLTTVSMNDEGGINYETFLSSIHVVDTSESPLDEESGKAIDLDSELPNPDDDVLDG